MKYGSGERVVRNPPSTHVCLPSPSVSSVCSSAGQVLLREQRLAGPTREYPRASGGEFPGVADEHDVLARDPLGRLEHHRVPEAVGRLVARADQRGADLLGARLRQPAAHQGLVLGAQRRPPVLPRQAEVLRREGGLGLQVIGVGDDRVRGRQRGDRGDELPGVPDIAADEPDRRAVTGGPGVIVLGRWSRTARAGQRSRPGAGPLVFLGLVGEQDDLESEPGRRREKAQHDGIGRFRGDKAEPH